MDKKNMLIKLMIAALVCPLLLSACSLIARCPTLEPCPTAEPLPTVLTRPSLVGTWEATIDTTTVDFTFEASGGFIMYMQGMQVDRGQYALLDTIDPIGINFIYEDGRVIYSIIEFFNADALRMENVMPGAPRPISFSEAYTYRKKSP